MAEVACIKFYRVVESWTNKMCPRQGVPNGGSSNCVRQVIICHFNHFAMSITNEISQLLQAVYGWAWQSKGWFKNINGCLPLSSDNSLDEESEHGEHGESSVLDLLDLELGKGVWVVSKSQGVECLTRVKGIETCKHQRDKLRNCLDEWMPKYTMLYHFRMFLRMVGLFSPIHMSILWF